MDLIGTTLGQYQIVAPIGHGGMAFVYQARQTSLDRFVAIKILLPQQASTPEFHARFLREAKAVAQLNHPNILPIIDYGQSDDLNYIVMKYVAGGTLADRLKQPIDLATTARFITQIAAALDHAHKRGIIHRDVKPSNVLLNEDEWAQLADFGLAKIMGGDQVLTHSGLSMGTPAYLSPEQGQGLPLDHHADIYSLGVVAYEMVTGRLPFTAETPVGVIIKHIYDQPVPPRALNPALPEAVAAIVLKAIAKPIEQRYHSAGQFAEDLQLAVAAAPIIALSPVVGVDSNATPQFSPHQQTPPSAVVISNKTLFEETVPTVPHFIGRQAEVAAYQARLERDQLVIITGLAGMGKTTLGAHLARQIAARPEDIFWFTFDQVENATADALYWALGAFLDNRGEPSLAHYLRGEVGAQRPLERTAKLNLLIAALTTGNYVLCFDDFHIVKDTPDIAYIFKVIRQRFVELKQPLPARMILMGREIPADLEYLVSAALRGLPEADAAQLVSDRGVTLPSELLRQLWERTDGNPKLIELSLGTLRDAPADDAAHFITTLARKSDIRDYLLTNVYAALSPEEQTVLSALSVFPGPIERAGLEEILAEEGIKSVARYLDALVNKHIVDETADERIDCHDLVRDYGYHILNRRDRDRYHGQAATFFEQEQNWLAAGHHHFQRRAYDAALDLLIAHADDIINSGGVAALSQQLGRFTPTVLTPEQQLALHKAQGNCWRIQGEYQQALAAFDAALDLTTTDEDRADLLHRLTSIHVILGDYEPALELAQQNLKVSEAANQSEIIANAHNDLGMTYLYLGHLAQAQQHLALCQQIAVRRNDKKLLAHNALELGLTAWKEKQLDEAREYFEASRKLFREIADRRNEAFALGNLGLICGELNDNTRQLSYYLQAVDIHRQIGDINGLQIAYNNLGYLYLSQEKHSLALANYAELADLARASGNKFMLCVAQAGLADAHLGSGAAQVALSCAVDALKLSESLERSMAQGISYRALADVWLALGSAAQAKFCYEQSLPILEEFKDEHDLIKARQGLHIAQRQLTTTASSRSSNSQRSQMS